MRNHAGSLLPYLRLPSLRWCYMLIHRFLVGRAEMLTHSVEYGHGIQIWRDHHTIRTEFDRLLKAYVARLAHWLSGRPHGNYCQSRRSPHLSVHHTTLKSGNKSIEREMTDYYQHKSCCMLSTRYGQRNEWNYRRQRPRIAPETAACYSTS